MDMSTFVSVLERGEWLLSLCVLVSAFATFIIGGKLLVLSPALRQTQQLNKETASERTGRSYYAPIQNRSKFWGLLTQIAVFTFVIPFSVTIAPRPWWDVLLDIFIILMTYDFVYYLVDRFPSRYLKYMSDMHHVHHARFIGGNFATISLFYDWLFGTYDTGNGWGKHKRA